MSLGKAFELCVLTSPGRGAVATIAVAGRGAAAAMALHVRTTAGVSATDLVMGRIYHGRCATDPGEEVVICRRAEGEFEIHCHGGLAAIEAIVTDLTSAGGERVTWREWLARNCPDEVAHAALVALTEARTERTANILLDQSHGALARAVHAICEILQRRDMVEAINRLRILVARGSLGLHLTRPYQVVLAGRPNVGKSSLINALVGYQRAIVFDEPGTTRDVVTAETAIDGWPVVLSDTAGLGASDDPLEQAGVRRARARLETCDLVVLVFDASRPRSAVDGRLQAEFKSALVVESKCDLPQSPQPAGAESCIRSSAVTGAGIAALLAAISRRLVPEPPAPGEAVPFAATQIEALREALASVERHDEPLAQEVLSRLTSGVRGARG